jgi:hypothetical protein
MAQLEKVVADEADIIRRALDSVPRPKNVKKVDFELGLDSTDAESVTIWIRIPSDANPTKSTMSKLTDFAARLRDAVFATGVTRFPYVRYRVAR